MKIPNKHACYIYSSETYKYAKFSLNRIIIQRIINISFKVNCHESSYLYRREMSYFLIFIYKKGYIYMYKK